MNSEKKPGMAEIWGGTQGLGLGSPQPAQNPHAARSVRSVDVCGAASPSAHVEKHILL